MPHTWRLSASRRQHIATALASRSQSTLSASQARIPSAAKPTSIPSRQQHTATADTTSSQTDSTSSSQPPRLSQADTFPQVPLRASRWKPYANVKERIHVATPLPPDVQEAYKRSVRLQEKARMGSISGVGASSNKPGSPLAFGDFTGATLSALQTDTTNFPSSAPLESLAILRACLGTNLLSRALKIFQDMRRSADSRFTTQDYIDMEARKPLTPAQRKRFATFSVMDISTYNAVLAAIGRRAAAEESPYEAQRWVDQAWTIYKEMETGNSSLAKSRRSGAKPLLWTTDPIPNAETVWTFSRGLIKAMQRHPSMAIEQSGLGDLVASAWRLGISFEAVIAPLPPTMAAIASSSMDPSPEELSTVKVIQLLKTAASQGGHDLARAAIEQAEARSQATGSKKSPGMSLNIANPAADIPEIKPMISRSQSPHEISPVDGDTRPLNLWLLQRSLSVVDQGRSSIGGDNEERQRWLEESALDTARRRLEADAQGRDAAGVVLGGSLSHDLTLQKWMFDWSTKLEAVLEREVARMKAENESGSPHIQEDLLEQNIAPFLQLIAPAKMALITVLELMRMQGSSRSAQDMKTTRALITIGMALEQEYYADVLKQNPHIVKNHYTATQFVRGKGVTNMQQRREAKKWLESQTTSIPYEPWTQSIRARIGSFVVGHLLDIAKVTRKAVDRDGETWEEEHPAIYATYNYVQGKKLGVIKVNDTVAERLDKGSVGSTLHPRFLPMLVKPRLWLGHESGGYLTHKNALMRTKDSAEQYLYLRKASENQSLETVGAGLDVLGETPWIINEDVFKVMVDVWNTGESVANMPPLLDESYGQVPRPDNYDTDLKARTEYLRASKQAQLERTSTYSLRCDTNYKLEIARAYLGEKFYFPHNVDFRGRAYPIPPHLNHIGNDLCRGLLLFADAKPLGKAGLRWLRIHLANVYGYDKASFDEREQFAFDHLADIEDAVKAPLTGKGWWLKADDPWQCLATCYELYNALQNPDGPEKFLSRIPVHQDGTCNGLQHYAALGGDLDGAKQVNLASGDRPSDVYTAVADLVIADIEREAMKPKGDYRAALLKGKITRKVVKQTVMTTVYGVTFIGAKNQVLKQLASRNDIPERELWTVSSFLATRVLRSVGNLFSGADKIQNWLVESAKLISKSIPPERVEQALEERQLGTQATAAAAAAAEEEALAQTSSSSPPPTSIDKENPSGKEVPSSKIRASRILREQMTSVIWTSPLGLPIVQPYRKNKKKQISTAMQTVFLSDPRQTSEVSPAKQASAFPPNFIHSLDATHMILTALECRDAGLTFASVHDSYWTHACDVETMSELIRDTFVRLHLQPILPTLRQEFLERYAGYKVPILTARNVEERRARKVAQKKLKLLQDEEEDAVDGQEPLEVSEAMAAQPDDASLANGITTDTDPALSTAAAELNVDIDVATDADADVEVDADDGKTSTSSSPKKGKKRIRFATGDDIGRSRQAREWVDARFVDLADVLPPLPEKGDFDVNEIKRSQYFFS